jgi:hypothetical protein
MSEIKKDLTLSSLRIDPTSDNASIMALDVEGPVSMTKTLAVTGALTCSSTISSLPKNTKLTENTTLTAANHGTTFLLDASTSFAITLPTATTEAAAEALVGTMYRFVLDVDHGSNDITIVRGDTSNDSITGFIFDAGNAYAVGAAAITIGSDVITFDASAAMAVGDYCECLCTHATSATVVWKVTGIASA